MCNCNPEGLTRTELNRKIVYLSNSIINSAIFGKTVNRERRLSLLRTYQPCRCK